MYKSENYYTLVKRKRKGKNVYSYYCYTPEGKRVMRGTGAKTRSEAVDIINKRIAEGKLVFPDGMAIRPNSTKPGAMTFKEYFKDFFDYDNCPLIAEQAARGKKLGKSTTMNRRCILTKRLMPVFGEYRLFEITPYMIDDWMIAEAKEKTRKNSTINMSLATLRIMLDYAVRRGDLKTNPADSIKPLGGTKSARRAFTDNEIRVLFTTPWSNQLVRLACMLSAVTGMRIGEVRALRPEQIKDGYIVVNASYNEQDLLKGTKTGKPREVPIPKRLQDILLGIGTKGGFIFAGRGNSPISVSTINDALEKQLEKCGIPKEGLCFHSFRHYANTKLVASNINAEKIRASIGHSSEAMTEHYLHLEAKDMQEITGVQNAILDSMEEG
jgi:integrase